MQKIVKTFLLPLAPVLWFASGTAWFAWHGWQEVHNPNPFATPGYFDWLRYLERLTPTWSAALALALLMFAAGGWFVWQQSRFDRWLLAAIGAAGLGLALSRPIANGFSLLMLLMLAATTAAAGRWLMRRLAITHAQTANTLFFAWVIGCGLLILCALALGVLHVLSPWTLGLTLVLAALAAREDLGWLLKTAVAWRPALPAGSGQRLMVLALAPFLALGLLGALAPIAAFDATWYHVFIPRLYLQAGGLDFFPAFYRSLWFSNVEMLNLWGLALAGDQLTQLISLSLTLLLLLGVFVATRQWFGTQIALLAILLTFTSPVIASYAPLAYVDIPLALFNLATFLAWLNWIQTDRPGWLLTAGWAAGLAAGAKLLGWPHLALLVLLTLGRLLWRPRAGRWPLFAAMLLAAALPSLPWLWRAWSLGGDPLFPFGFRWFAETTWNECTDLLHKSHFAYVGVGKVRTLPAFGIVLELIVLYASGVWISLGWLLTLPPLLRVKFGNRQRLLLWLMIAGALLTLGQAFLFPMPRFFIFAQTLGAIVAAASTWFYLTHGPAWSRWFITALLTIAIGLGLAHAAAARPDAVRVVWGLESEEQALSRGLPEYDAIAWANQHLPTEARVLNWSLRGSFLWRDQVPVDPAFQGLLDFSQLTDARRFLARLDELGITHLLVLPDGSQFFYPQGDEVTAHLDAFLAAADSHLTLLYERSGTRVYAIDTEASIPPTPLPGIALCRPGSAAR